MNNDCGTFIFCSIGGNRAVYIHQLTKKRSQVCNMLLAYTDYIILLQNPFQRSKGLVQKVLFHPTKPIFFVAVSQINWPVIFCNGWIVVITHNDFCVDFIVDTEVRTDIRLGETGTSQEVVDGSTVDIKYWHSSTRLLRILLCGNTF